jgi:site-specific DNA recombinase
MIDELTKAGIIFKSITEPFDTASAAGKMMVQMLGVFAEFEHSAIVERTVLGMQRKARSGLWVGGAAPFGYTSQDTRLVPQEDEATIVREMFEKYIELGSLISVVEHLDRRGIRNRRGRAFDKTGLRWILGNPVYVAKIRYGGQVLDGAHQAIITQEVWDTVQDQLRQNGDPGRRRSEPGSGALLSGLLRCGACGGSLCVQSARRGSKKYTYYTCATYQKRGASACPGSRVPTHEMERFVLDRIRDIGRDHRLVAETIKAAQRQLKTRRPEIEADLKRVEKERKKLLAERANLVEAVGKGKAKASLLERLGEVELEMGKLEAEAARLRAEVDALEQGTIDEADLKQALASFTPVWDVLFPAEKARIVHLLLERVTYDATAGEVAITFRPGGVRILASHEAKEAT